MTTDQLALEAQQGCPLAFAELAHELRGLIFVEAEKVWWPGSDRDDRTQEALIGLWVAARGWRPELGPFLPFAKFVIRRRLIDALKMATREKHVALNTAAGGDALLAHEIHPVSPPPAEIVEQRQKLRAIREAVIQFTPLEREALAGTLNGGAYRGPKTVAMKRLDNAAQRARRRLERAVAA